MSDFRSHRVPPLLQPQGTSVSSSASILGRSDGYPGTYTYRGSFPPPPLSSLGEIGRMPPYTATPRALESSIERTQNLYLGPGMLMDPVQPRLPQPVADAPPFHETYNIQPIVSGAQSIKPEIQAKIHKGFFQVDEKWTCYRRNYFSVSCSFSLQPWAPSQQLYVKFSEQATERIQTWSMSISAIVNAQYGEPRELVQHTPKRDKQSESKPKKIVLQPSQPPPLVLSHGASSTSTQHSFSLASQSPGLSLDYSPYANTAQPSHPPTQHTFERIQFQKATANNGKRRAQQQYYNLVVELYAGISNPVPGGEPYQWIKVARRLSHPMVVRGRSPGHYKDGRRDGSTSMGPDGGSGGSGDGSGGAVLPSGLGSAARSHFIMPYDPSQRNGPHYGRTDYHQMTSSDQSPLSESPHISSSSSSTFDIGLNTMDPMDSMKSTSSMDSYQDPNFTGMNNRKPPSHFPHQLPSFDFEPISKPAEETNHSFPGTYDSLVPLLTNDQHEPPHYMKHAHRPASHMYQHSSSSGYDPIYSAARTADGTSYGRFPNTPSLCV
ncbi:p53-like transcription factor [Aspergillus sclerotioniger CBS 115572]|uniref:p53-like transcription factor n=1 Tax=Aspergillus sclerotioniger CBS 115572 TaxID=1450535 RepID=A0A317VNA6_9EURO|nr:p53-like transcription factor [Aspergillus sclerotioniger CBS 115572]PWY74567.1 p53-like transcription factor [Aspergillus sclerotioniger CBS 115572]